MSVLKKFSQKIKPKHDPAKNRFLKSRDKFTDKLLEFFEKLVIFHLKKVPIPLN